MSKGMREREKMLDAANNGTALVPHSRLRAKRPSLPHPWGSFSALTLNGCNSHGAIGQLENGKGMPIIRLCSGARFVRSWYVRIRNPTRGLVLMVPY
jgi:hypothetical protein